jgi:hypothetical protein
MSGAAGFTHSLFERLRAWIELFCTRQDLELRSELEVRKDPERPGAVPYPPDAREFGEQATFVGFSYRLKGDASGAGGYLYLSLEGFLEDAYMELDGEEVDPDAMYMLDCDREGTGFAAWYVLRQDRPPLIVWDLETTERFSSLTEYLTEGARRGFSYNPCWQSRGQKTPLDGASVPGSTPLADLEKALVARGATATVAADLVRWLGSDVRLLVPAEPALSASVQPSGRTAASETFLVYRVRDLPVELSAPFGVSAEVGDKLFYATRGDNPLLPALFEALPEPDLAGADAGLQLARSVGRIVSESTQAHIRVKAHGSFSYGFHAGDPATVEQWLRQHGASLVPIGELLAHVLVLRVENAEPGETLTLVSGDVETQAPARELGLYVFDRDDSTFAAFVLRGAKGTARVSAADVPPGTVGAVRLG